MILLCILQVKLKGSALVQSQALKMLGALVEAWLLNVFYRVKP